MANGSNNRKPEPVGGPGTNQYGIVGAPKRPEPSGGGVLPQPKLDVEAMIGAPRDVGEPPQSLKCGDIWGTKCSEMVSPPDYVHGDMQCVKAALSARGGRRGMLRNLNNNEIIALSKSHSPYIWLAISMTDRMLPEEVYATISPERLIGRLSKIWNTQDEPEQQGPPVQPSMPAGPGFPQAGGLPQAGDQPAPAKALPKPKQTTRSVSTAKTATERAARNFMSRPDCAKPVLSQWGESLKKHKARKDCPEDLLNLLIIQLVSNPLCPTDLLDWATDSIKDTDVHLALLAREDMSTNWLADMAETTDDEKVMDAILKHSRCDYVVRKIIEDRRNPDPEKNKQLEVVTFGWRGSE